jgi:hypothetical protein
MNSSENMYVHYSNKLINILRVTETHMLIRYCQEWEWSAPRVVERPRGWTCSRTAVMRTRVLNLVRNEDFLGGSRVLSGSAKRTRYLLTRICLYFSPRTQKKKGLGTLYILPRPRFRNRHYQALFLIFEFLTEKYELYIDPPPRYDFGWRLSRM